MCDYSDEYIAVKGTITFEGTSPVNRRRNKKLTFKNTAPIRLCISKINNTFIENGENLDIVMSMHNLLEYSDIYSITSGSSWNYCRDEVDDYANEVNNKYRKI